MPHQGSIDWKKNLYAIFAAEFLAIVGFSVSMPLVPFYLQDLGVSDPTRLKFWVGSCNAAGSITLAVFSAIWGKIADLYGRRLMLLRAMFGGAVVLALTGVVAAPWQLLVIRALQGTMTGSVTAANTLVASVTPEDRVGYGLGLVQTSVFVGAAVGPMLGGMIFDMAGPRVAFFVTGFLLMCGGLVILRYVREDFTPRRPARPLWRQVVPNFRLVLGSPALIVIFLLIFTVYVSQSAVWSILPLYVQSLAAVGSPVGIITGTIFGFTAVAAAVSSVIVGRVSARIGFRRSLLICIVGATIMFVPHAFVSSPWQLLPFRILGGFFLGGTIPAANSLIFILAKKENQGEVFGLSFSAGAAGMSVGPVLSASVSALWGFPAAFLAVALVLLAATVILLSMPTIRKPRPGDERT